MAVKVVGKSDQAVYRTVCGHCSSILEYTRSDTTTVVTYDYTGSRELEFHLECPVCKNKFAVGFKK